MWTFVILYILGLNICQATGQGNSTQMYYVKLKIEEGVIANISEKLTPFVRDATLTVDNLEMTTICQSVEVGTKCQCKSDFSWSDEVCQKSSPKCCGSKTCTFSGNSAHKCVSDKRVVINGFITLKAPEHLKCLGKNDSNEFRECNDDLLRKMKTVYSTLEGFDVLTISNFRVGSVIADFEMILAYSVLNKNLTEKTKLLSRNLAASIDLATSGVVNLTMPPQSPVCHYDQPILRCTTEEDLSTTPVWQLKRAGSVYKIFNGTESEVTSAQLETRVTLRNISELWAGEYTCIYNSKFESNIISHKASAVMDISVLPRIDATMTPEYPRCFNDSEILTIRVKCEMESNSSEVYNVTWDNHVNILSGPFEDPRDPYAAYVSASCDSSRPTPQLTCTLKNRCMEERAATIHVNIIYANVQFCAAEGDWEDTKANFTAVLKCTDAVGQRQRKCKLGPTQATWEPEVSACVNQEMNNVLQRAQIVDIGLGSLHGNAANVFSILESVTDDSLLINTFPNMNAAVQVLSSLSKKLHNIANESAVDDFLESSSNLLQKSLNKSWTTNTSDEGTISLAEQYLASVEHLIRMANVTLSPKKKNIEVATSKCVKGSQCKNTVYNVSVVLLSPDPVNVKTAGFQQLENYLPHEDEEYEPNSIVVSTTTDRKRMDSVKGKGKVEDKVEIRINFTLHKPRPRNVLMKCVSWDNTTRDWSSKGCEWKGTSNQGLCVCNHLSSFSILMSKHPVDVKGISELTFVGVSLSVVSLIITLMIELVVWSAVVKTNTLYLRHAAHVNICLCLLVADCCFLASFNPSDISDMWCKISVVLKHFCYLSMFFWMLCLSSMVLHQAIFLFHNVSKKAYLRFSLVLGYGCPLLIVVVSFLTYKSGAEGTYYSNETCWLVYNGVMEGSIHTFVIPVGVIVFFNVFSMVVVIMKLLNMNTEKVREKEKKAAVAVMRSVILLTPIFGVTWIFGFAVLLVDLTSGIVPHIIHYAFNLLNAFQGLFILLTTCLGDKLTRDALMSYMKKNAPQSTTDSTVKSESTWKK